jgi:hypothetical protein
MLCHYAECHYGECGVLFTIILTAIMLSVVMLSVVILCVVAPWWCVDSVSEFQSLVKPLLGPFQLKVIPRVKIRGLRVAEKSG